MNFVNETKLKLHDIFYLACERLFPSIFIDPKIKIGGYIFYKLFTDSRG